MEEKIVTVLNEMAAYLSIAQMKKESLEMSQMLVRAIEFLLQNLLKRVFLFIEEQR